jgi:hypothetical protein
MRSVSSPFHNSRHVANNSSVTKTFLVSAAGFIVAASRPVKAIAAR